MVCRTSTSTNTQWIPSKLKLNLKLKPVQLWCLENKLQTKSSNIAIMKSTFRPTFRNANQESTPEVCELDWDFLPVQCQGAHKHSLHCNVQVLVTNSNGMLDVNVNDWALKVRDSTNTQPQALFNAHRRTLPWSPHAVPSINPGNIRAIHNTGKHLKLEFYLTATPKQTLIL